MFLLNENEVNGREYGGAPEGPLVLMAVKQTQEGPLPKVTREQLLAAKRVSERQWVVSSANGLVTMLPFTSLGTLPYTTYLNVG